MLLVWSGSFVTMAISGKSLCRAKNRFMLIGPIFCKLYVLGLISDWSLKNMTPYSANASLILIKSSAKFVG